MEKCLGDRILIHTDYNGVGKLQYVAGQMGLTILNTQYTDQVDMTFMVPVDQTGSFLSQVTEKTAGRAQIEREGTLYYGMLDGEMILFED